MNRLADYFGDYAHEINTHLRTRRGLLGINVQLEKKRNSIAERILKYEHKHESRLRVTRARLKAAETVYKDAVVEEAECWENYCKKCDDITSLIHCIGLIFLRLLHQQPSVEERARKSNTYQIEWAAAQHSLINAKKEWEAAKTEYHNLSDRLESDRYAIQALANQLAQLSAQLEAEEDAITRIITLTARNMSFRSLARKQSCGLNVDEGFYLDVRRLRQLYTRLDALQPLMRESQIRQSPKLQCENLTTAIDHSFDTRKLPLKCKIQLKGKGTLKDLNPEYSSTSVDRVNTNNRRVFFGDTKTFKPMILQKRWRSEPVSRDLTVRTLSILSSSMGSAAKNEVENISQRLESEIRVLTRKLAKSIFAVVGE
ncbi:MAG: hypothetical protein CMM01_24925 [Rhodopirellula sp.]|nr:hypothetical protein [Rhodopirellula sp.]